MTRGRKPTTAVDEAKRCAGHMGYRWMENTGRDLPFDLLVFKKESVRAVKVRQVRYCIGPEIFYEEQYPEEVAGLRNLPFPPCVVRELWLRSRGERVFRRLHVTDVSVGEIEWWGPDNYVNPHARRDAPEKRGPTGKFIVREVPGTPRILPRPETTEEY